MSNEPRELDPTIVEVHDLIDSPGAQRPLELDVGLPEGFGIPLTTFGDEVRVDGVLESLVDGILVRGIVATELSQQCALCLEPIEERTMSVDVAELYSDPATTERPADIEEGFELSGGTIDIDALIRDTLVQGITQTPKCKPDCAGICPSCGINRNDATCDCADDFVDDRWAALANLDITK